MESYYMFNFNSFANTLPPTPLKRVFTTSSPCPVPILNIVFNFTCKTIVQDWISHEYSTDIVAQHPCYEIDTSFELNLPKNVSASRCLKTEIARELCHWPIPDPCRCLMIKSVVGATMRQINSSNPYDNNFLVDVVAAHLRNNFYVLETFPKMVPATDESIESLEKTKGTDYGRCSICLEDFSEDCLAAKMPCSHAFHDYCIERWLKNSHYCPLCRYEMPITS